MIHLKSPRRLMAASLLLALAAAGSAQAACSVTSTGLAFGAYQPLAFSGKLTSADVPSTATVSVTCTLHLTGYTLTLGAGNYGPGNRISTRYLNNGTNGGPYMAYNVYTDASYNTPWGDGTAGSGSAITGSIDLFCLLPCTRTHTVNGKIPAGQNTLKAGSFSDTLTITVTYLLL